MGDWKRIDEGFGHSIVCSFNNTPFRFLAIERPSPRLKDIIKAFADTLSDQLLGRQLRRAALAEKPFTSVADALRGRPTEPCAWREHVNEACTVEAGEFLVEHDISNEAALVLISDSDPEAALYVH